jgi:hypothetical protein
MGMAAADCLKNKLEAIWIFMRFVERGIFGTARNGIHVSLNAEVASVHVHGLNFAATSLGREQGCGTAAPSERDCKSDCRG